MMKGTIFYFFISFFVFFLHTVSSQEESNNTKNYNNEDYKQLEELEKYIDNLRNTVTHKFFENYKDDIQSLKKKIQNIEKKNNNNVTGQDMDDDDEEEDQNSYDENDDEYNDLDIEQKKLLQSNMKSFLGQSGTDNTVPVQETNGQTSDAPAGEAGRENEQSDKAKTAEKAAQNDQPNASSLPSTNEESSSSQNTSDESSGSTTDPKNGEESQKAAVVSNLKNIDKLYDDVLKHLEKENDLKDNTYNNFKNKFDQFILNDFEYKLLKKLILDFFKDDQQDDKTKNKFYDALKKALTNETFSQEFKNVMYGLYSYAKRHSYLRGKDEKVELYNKVYQNAISLLDTMMTKNFESETNEQVPQVQEAKEEKQQEETEAQKKSEQEAKQEPEVEKEEEEEEEEEKEEREETATPTET
ncbi:MSP7-like protein, putative [Plasmodium sp. gorilla clade G2]|uniref:MSP7-like protein, putative n=1 Tax=Plasmodium sp. gorilla clade G2 TaxID=880535 RepID=UPI000D2B982F|nr:MSP7-like protein, putative [Plasmodium sp. gorilla clade G2]SOV20111.1 MSP7-like protein, putative [Plasmodium sp. gorilla clade G2]